MGPVKTAGRPRGTILGSVQAELVTFAVRAMPLPEDITAFLITNGTTLKRLQRDRRAGREEDDDGDVRLEGAEAVEPVKVEEFWPKLEELFKAAGKDWVGIADQIWAFGPKRIGPNILVDRTPSSLRSCVFLFGFFVARSANPLGFSLRKRLDRQATLPSSSATPAVARSPNGSPQVSAADSSSLPPLDAAALQSQLEEPKPTSQAAQTLPDVRELDENLDTAFQLAMNRGPLCAEPVIGMAYFLETVDLNAGDMTPSQGAFGRLVAPRVLEADFMRLQFAPSGLTRAGTSSRRDRMSSGTACWTGRLDCS